jgi:predicted S18 family serine protease
VRAAEKITGVSLSKTDVILTITAAKEVEIVDGSSAGAAISVALITMLTDREIADSVYITGMIWIDGSIGPVNSIPQKAIAAAEKGASVFIVPIDQSTVSIYTPEKKTVSLQSYLEENGYYITVEEAENVEEIIAKFTSN